MKSLHDIFEEYLVQHIHKLYLDPDVIEVSANPKTIGMIEDEMREYYAIFNKEKMTELESMMVFYQGQKFKFMRNVKVGDGTLIFKNPENGEHRLFHNYSFSKS